MVLLAAFAIVLTAAVLCRRQAVRASVERRDILSDCAKLFDAPPAQGVDRAGFGTLSGRVRDLPVHVSLLAESLAFRRLPQLWLRVEVRTIMGGTGSLNIVRRFTNAEFYAPASELPLRYDVPSQWPQDTVIRGSPGSEPLMRRLAGQLDLLLSDPRLKEILVTPRGLRISKQVREGDRGAYLLLRGSRFGREPIALRDVLEALDAAVDLAQALQPEEHHRAGVPIRA